MADSYQSKLGDDAGMGGLLGQSAGMVALKRKLRQVIEAERSLDDNDPPTVLILGETGTGKGLVARALHFNGPRRDKPFVEINCGSMQQNLLGSELFGHEREIGLFETADGGTLFLDEIGDMDIALQARVLKVIEEKSMRRLGSTRDQRINVRIVAATHRSLETLTREGKFRSDLYFRLRIVQLDVPPLRQRGDDTLSLAKHFLALHAARYGRDKMRYDASAEQMLAQHRWPGNVRELRNIVEQAVLLARGDIIEGSHLNLCSPLVFREEAQPVPAALDAAARFPRGGVQLARVERDLLVRALKIRRIGMPGVRALSGQRKGS